MFDLHDNDRLLEWKRIRSQIEISNNPLDIVIDTWCRAPFVSKFIDPYSPNDWPDPWRLVLDGKFDNLAICLGMLYTLQLTQRFMHSQYEIHMSNIPKMKEPAFYMSVDRSFILNYTYKQVVDYDDDRLKDTTLLFVTKK